MLVRAVGTETTSDPSQLSVSSHNGLLSFDLAGRTAINNPSNEGTNIDGSIVLIVISPSQSQQFTDP
jgi:hypothetical protein